MNRVARQQARLQHAAWQRGGRWVLYECACLLASQVVGPTEGLASVALEYDVEHECARVNEGVRISRAEIETLAGCRRAAGLGEHLPRDKRRAAAARARGRTHGDLCEYCNGRGEQMIGRMMVSCDWCRGSGMRTACSLCHDTGEYCGKPCHLCAAGKDRVQRGKATTPFRDPYADRGGVQLIDPETLARMIRRAGMAVPQ